MKVLALLASVLAPMASAQRRAQTGGNPDCYVCGDETATVGNQSDVQAPLPPSFEAPPGAPALSCSLLETAGVGGLIEESNCSALLNSPDFAEFCQCSNFVAPTTEPTTSPVAAETGVPIASTTEPTISPVAAESGVPIASPVVSDESAAPSAEPTTSSSPVPTNQDEPTVGDVPVVAPSSSTTASPVIEVGDVPSYDHTPASSSSSSNKSDKMPKTIKGKGSKGTKSEKKSIQEDKESKKSKLRASGGKGKGDTSTKASKSINASKSTKASKSSKAPKSTQASKGTQSSKGASNSSNGDKSSKGTKAPKASTKNDPESDMEFSSDPKSSKN